MADMGLFSLAGGALNLSSTLVKIHKEHAKHPDKAPGLADIMKTIPGAAFEASGRVIAEVDKFERECKEAGIDLKQTLDELKTRPGFWLSNRRRIIKNFSARTTAISQEVAILFDDVVAISNCSESEELIAAGYAQALELKNALRKGIDEELPVGEILRNLRAHAEKIRAELGDMGKEKGKK